MTLMSLVTLVTLVIKTLNKSNIAQGNFLVFRLVHHECNFNRFLIIKMMQHRSNKSNMAYVDAQIKSKNYVMFGEEHSLYFSHDQLIGSSLDDRIVFTFASASNIIGDFCPRQWLCHSNFHKEKMLKKNSNQAMLLGTSTICYDPSPEIKIFFSWECTDRVKWLLANSVLVDRSPGDMIIVSQ